MGYTGAFSPGSRHPTYKNIQDFAEAVRVTFDPERTSVRKMIDVFFASHTPEDPASAGTQYRSAIFFHTPEHARIAREAVEEWSLFGRHVSVENARDFYQAEERHQRFMNKW